MPPPILVFGTHGVGGNALLFYLKCCTQVRLIEIGYDETQHLPNGTDQRVWFFQRHFLFQPKFLSPEKKIVEAERALAVRDPLQVIKSNLNARVYNTVMGDKVGEQTDDLIITEFARAHLHFCDFTPLIGLSDERLSKITFFDWAELGQLDNNRRKARLNRFLSLPGSTEPVNFRFDYSYESGPQRVLRGLLIEENAANATTTAPLSYEILDYLNYPNGNDSPPREILSSRAVELAEFAARQPEICVTCDRATWEADSKTGKARSRGKAERLLDDRALARIQQKFSSRWERYCGCSYSLDDVRECLARNSKVRNEIRRVVLAARAFSRHRFAEIEASFDKSRSFVGGC